MSAMTAKCWRCKDWIAPMARRVALTGVHGLWICGKCRKRFGDVFEFRCWHEDAGETQEQAEPVVASTPRRAAELFAEQCFYEMATATGTGPDFQVIGVVGFRGLFMVTAERTIVFSARPYEPKRKETAR